MLPVWFFDLFAGDFSLSFEVGSADAWPLRAMRSRVSRAGASPRLTLRMSVPPAPGRAELLPIEALALGWREAESGLAERFGHPRAALADDAQRAFELGRVARDRSLLQIADRLRAKGLELRAHVIGEERVADRK